MKIKFHRFFSILYFFFLALSVTLCLSFFLTLFVTLSVSPLHRLHFSESIYLFPRFSTFCSPPLAILKSFCYQSLCLKGLLSLFVHKPHTGSLLCHFINFSSTLAHEAGVYSFIPAAMSLQTPFFKHPLRRLDLNLILQIADHFPHHGTYLF